MRGEQFQVSQSFIGVYRRLPISLPDSVRHYQRARRSNSGVTLICEKKLLNKKKTYTDDSVATREQKWLAGAPAGNLQTSSELIFGMRDDTSNQSACRGLSLFVLFIVCYQSCELPAIN